MNRTNKISLSCLFIVLSMLLSGLYAVAQDSVIDRQIRKTTFTYNTRDTDILKMDVYSLETGAKKRPCVVFVFGGGFYTGKRDQSYYHPYFNALAKQGYAVASIDYRLGLKGGKKVTPLKTKPLKEAIAMAVTDLYDATAYLIAHASDLGIDTGKIMISGSSAGAITALQADWEKRNHTAVTAPLPESFQYKGVIAFAGAILSYSGAPDYKIPPAPTMLFHGTEDKIVVYNKKRFFNKGFFGSNYLACRFKDKKYPYYFRRVYNRGHEIAGTPMYENLADILWFIDNYVLQAKPWMIEYDFNDPEARPTYGH